MARYALRTNYTLEIRLAAQDISSKIDLHNTQPRKILEYSNKIYSQNKFIKLHVVSVK